jgi:hypothetical protein
VLNKYHAMKTYWRVKVWLHAFIDPALHGGEWSASHPGGFVPEKEPKVPTGYEVVWAPESA